MSSTDKVILRQLTVDDAEIFYKIYSHPLLTVNFDGSPFLPAETPIDFTKRIISFCNYSFTIRSADNPDIIIGDCALHHWDDNMKEVAMGGSLFPEYWGMGYMQDAFRQLTLIAKHELGARIILGQTKSRNVKAIRLLEKMGFKIHLLDGQDTLWRKKI